MRLAEFFASANGGARSHPSQRALVERVAATGRWPNIAAPTGPGKSAVIDVHVFLVAEHGAGRLGVRPPRRLVLVAPRRVLVDDEFERASRLAGLLSDALPAITAARRLRPRGDAGAAANGRRARRAAAAAAGVEPAWRCAARQRLAPGAICVPGDLRDPADVGLASAAARVWRVARVAGLQVVAMSATQPGRGLPRSRDVSAR